MAEFLKDNMEAERRGAAEGAPPGTTSRSGSRILRAEYVDMAELLKTIWRQREEVLQRELPLAPPAGQAAASLGRSMSTWRSSSKTIIMEAERRGAAEGAPPGATSRSGSRILRAEYIDMAELLKDNMEVERRGATEGAPPGATSRTGSRILRADIGCGVCRHGRAPQRQYGGGEKRCRRGSSAWHHQQVRQPHP